MLTFYKLHLLLLADSQFVQRCQMAYELGNYTIAEMSVALFHCSASGEIYHLTTKGVKLNVIPLADGRVEIFGKVRAKIYPPLPKKLRVASNTKGPP